MLGENHRAIKGPKGEGGQRTSGRGGPLQEGEQGAKGEGQQPADRINRERGQCLSMCDDSAAVLLYCCELHAPHLSLFQTAFTCLSFVLWLCAPPADRLLGLC